LLLHLPLIILLSSNQLLQQIPCSFDIYAGEGEGGEERRRGEEREERRGRRGEGGEEREGSKDADERNGKVLLRTTK
jgi:hypothetical protein